MGISKDQKMSEKEHIMAAAALKATCYYAKEASRIVYRHFPAKGFIMRYLFNMHPANPKSMMIRLITLLRRNRNKYRTFDELEEPEDAIDDPYAKIDETDPDRLDENLPYELRSMIEKEIRFALEDVMRQMFSDKQVYQTIMELTDNVMHAITMSRFN